MKIQMLVHLSGVGYLLAPGDVTERFDDAEALRIVKAGYAAVVMDAGLERTVATPVTERRDDRRKGKDRR